MAAMGGGVLRKLAGTQGSRKRLLRPYQSTRRLEIEQSVEEL